MRTTNSENSNFSIDNSTTICLMFLFWQSHSDNSILFGN